jgi:hypothetical protein
LKIKKIRRNDRASGKHMIVGLNDKGVVAGTR